MSSSGTQQEYLTILYLEPNQVIAAFGYGGRIDTTGTTRYQVLSGTMYYQVPVMSGICLFYFGCKAISCSSSLQVHYRYIRYMRYTRYIRHIGYVRYNRYVR